MNIKVAAFTVTQNLNYTNEEDKSDSTQIQSSGLVAHENSTFKNLTLAVSGPFMA